MKSVSAVLLCLVAAVGISAAPQPVVTAAPVARNNLVERQDISQLVSGLSGFNPFTDSEIASFLSGNTGAVNSALSAQSSALASALGTKSAAAINSAASSLLNGGATVTPSSGSGNGAMSFNVPAFGAAVGALGAGAVLVIAAL